MTDRSRVVLTMLLGAVGGGLAGYLLLTERGSRIRAELEPRLKDIAAEMRRLGATIEEVASAARDGWHSVGQLVAADRSAAVTADEVTRH